MSDLIVIAYDNRETAMTVRQRLFELPRQHVITLDDAELIMKLGFRYQRSHGLSGPSVIMICRS